MTNQNFYPWDYDTGKEAELERKLSYANMRFHVAMSALTGLVLGLAVAWILWG